MKSREKASGFREGTHTHRVGAGGRSGRPIYIYVIYYDTYMLSTHYYTYKVVSMQLVHVKVVHILIKRVVRGTARKRERMIRGDKHKRKIAHVHRGRTRGRDKKGEGAP